MIMARFKKDEKTDMDLIEKITKLSEDIREEFDMMEVIEDEIKDLFSCDLNCKTCSVEEQGQCLQNFKKANIYWLRKIVQDEVFLKDIVEKMEEMRDNLFELAEALKISLELAKKRNDLNERMKKKMDIRRQQMYYT